MQEIDVKYVFEVYEEKMNELNRELMLAKARVKHLENENSQIKDFIKNSQSYTDKGKLVKKDDKGSETNE